MQIWRIRLGETQLGFRKQEWRLKMKQQRKSFMERILRIKQIFSKPTKKDYKFYENLHPDNYKSELEDWYKRKTGETLDLENPKTFNEKMQWLKLYDSTPLKTRLTDKYLVRDWVRGQIGEKYLIPLYGVWDKFDDIDFDKLPDAFALKTNHGCKWHIIVSDKRTLDKAEAKRKIGKWLKTNFAFLYGLELQYKDIPPKIIAEELIENNGVVPFDYKIFCFHGAPKFILLNAEKHIELKMAFYDLDWNPLPFSISYPQYEEFVPKPDNLDEMLNIAAKLSRDFIHARVDLYRLDDGSLKFGELTFSSFTGMGKWSPKEYDMIFGEMIVLPETRKRAEK
jgi:hypothetical protein